MYCNICGLHFSNNFSFKRHINRKHKLNENNETVNTTNENVISHSFNMNELIILPEKLHGKWRHPFTCIISGPTKAGKTEWVKKFVSNIKFMTTDTPKNIYWLYSEWQPAYHNLENVIFVDSLPNIEEFKNGEPNLLIIDDMMQEMKNDKQLSNIFTKGSHHWNLSCIHIVQNLFFTGLRTSRINAQYIVLMKNPSDKLQITNLGRQLFPRNINSFIESYNDACSMPYGYLLIDLTQETEEAMRLKTDIFPDKITIYYTPKNFRYKSL